MNRLCASVFILLWNSSIYAQCTPAFSLPTISCSGQSVQITNNSSATIDSSVWYWSGTNAGRTSFPGNHNLTQSFSNAGSTQICLAIDSGTCRDTLCQTLVINQSPGSGPGPVACVHCAGRVIGKRDRWIGTCCGCHSKSGMTLSREIISEQNQANK